MKEHLLGCACTNCRAHETYIAHGYQLGRFAELRNLKADLRRLQSRGYIIPEIVFDEIEKWLGPAPTETD